MEAKVFSTSFKILKLKINLQPEKSLKILKLVRTQFSLGRYLKKLSLKLYTPWYPYFLYRHQDLHFIYLNKVKNVKPFFAKLFQGDGISHESLTKICKAMESEKWSLVTLSLKFPVF